MYRKFTPLTLLLLWPVQLAHTATCGYVAIEGSICEICYEEADGDPDKWYKCDRRKDLRYCMPDDYGFRCVDYTNQCEGNRLRYGGYINCLNNANYVVDGECDLETHGADDNEGDPCP